MIGYYAENVDFVSYHDLEGKPCFKMAIQVVNDKWYLYLTHLWQSAWTIMDITDPSTPRKIKEIPGPENTWTLNIQVADRLMLTGLEQVKESWGGNPEASFEEGLYIWDVSNPTEPRKLSHWKTGYLGTHRNHYEGGRYAHLTAAMPGFIGYIYVILDMGNPEQPQEVGRWFLPEQYAAGGARPGRMPFVGLHGPAYIDGNRAYLGYGQGGMVILDISDYSNPQLVSRLDFGPALGSRLGLHTVLPMKNRDIALVCSEAIAEDANEPLNYAGIVDISDETKPRLISLFPIPLPPPGVSYPNFNKRGGRFGPHNFHHYQNQSHLYKSDNLAFMANFNAGFRVYDIKDPYIPKEVGYFLPHDPIERKGLLPKKLVTQSEDVIVDKRGYAYFTDKNHGLFIVRYSGI